MRFSIFDSNFNFYRVFKLTYDSKPSLALAASIKDADGNSVTLKKAGTKIELMITYGMRWDKNDKEWKPLVHSGLLCTDNEFICSVSMKIYLHAL